MLKLEGNFALAKYKSDPVHFKTKNKNKQKLLLFLHTKVV